MAAKIKKGDRSSCSSGRDKGKRGEVRQVIPDESARSSRGVNLSSATPTPDRRRPRAASSSRKRRSICPIWRSPTRRTGKPTRVGFKILDDGRKVRVAKRSGDLIDG